MQDVNPHRTKWERYLPIRRTKLRTYLILSGIIIGVLDLNNIQLVPFAVGVVFMALASWVHVWSKGHLDKNHTLTRSGPYRWVRDPFHLSNFFMDLGMCLIINNWVFTLIFMTFWVIAYNYRLGEEHEMLLKLFGDDYLEYKARIPRMIPWRKPMSKALYGKPFSVRHAPIWEGNVCTRLFRFASYPYLLFAAAQVGNYGAEAFNLAAHPYFYWALAGFVWFYVWGGAAEKLTKKRKPLLPRGALKEAVPMALALVFLLALAAFDRLDPGLAATEASLSLPSIGVAGAAMAVLALLTPGRLWQSYRFRRLVEAVWLVLVSLFVSVSVVVFLPLCYFVPAFIYGNPAREQSDVENVFTLDEGLIPRPAYTAFLALLVAAGLWVAWL